MPFGVKLVHSVAGGRASLEGDVELVRKFDALPRKLARKALKAGVRAGGKIVVDRAKEFAERSKVTGLTQKSLGQKPYAWKNKEGYGTVIGAQKGFRRAQVRGRDGLKALSKKKTAALVAASPTKVKFRNPVNTLHLVELGTEHSAAKPILRPALDSTRGQVVAAIATEVRKQIEAITVTSK